MPTVMPSQDGTTPSQAIIDAYDSLRHRLSRTRPAGPSKDRVRRYIETGGVHPD